VVISLSRLSRVFHSPFSRWIDAYIYMLHRNINLLRLRLVAEGWTWVLVADFDSEILYLKNLYLLSLDNMTLSEPMLARSCSHACLMKTTPMTPTMMVFIKSPAWLSSHSEWQFKGMQYMPFELYDSLCWALQHG
jgi:hypothetical protein